MMIKLPGCEIRLSARWILVRCAGAGTPERVWYRDRDQRERIEGYLALLKERPELFANGDSLRICTDRAAMLEFEEMTGKKVGLVHNNPPYQHILSDMIGGPKPFAYIRVVPCQKEAGTVMLPRWTDTNGKEYFGVLKLYRHALRTSALELPRGHLDPGLTPEENAVKELGEEFGIRREYVRALVELGCGYADSGLTSGMVRFYLADVTGPRPEASCGHEGIQGGIWLPREAFLDAIRSGTITDGMTMNALLHFLLKDDAHGSLDNK